MLPFIFDTSKGETPQSIALKRELAARIMGQGGRRAPQNVGEGWGSVLASIGDGITANVLNRRANAAETAGKDSASAAFNPIMDAFRSRTGLDANGFPAAPSGGGNLPDAAQTGGGGQQSFNGSQQEFIDMLMPAAVEASQRTGIDPRIIVAQAAQETGWGRSAPGNNYFGIKSHGKGGGQTFATHEYVDGKRVNVRDSFRQFDSPEDSVAGYADFIQQNPRYRPLMAAEGLDAQLEALQASGYATDPNYSRSVGSIARGIQMPQAGPAAAAEALATGQQMPPSPTAAPPLSDAAFNQRFAMDGSPAPAMRDGSGIPGAQQFIDQRMAGFAPQQNAAPPMPAPQMVQDRPVAPVQMAQAGGFPEMAGQNPQAIPAPQGPDMQQLIQVLTHPFASDQQKAVAQMLLQQQMQAQDPMRQMQLEKGRLELDAMRNPTPKDTDDIREYNYAREQGYQGSFTDFMTDMRRAGATSVNVGAGEKAWDQESAKLFAKRYDDISAGAMNAQQMMGMYDLAEQALNSGVRTGIGAEAELTLRQMGAAMGMDTDPKKLAGGELIRAVQNRMALTMRSPDGGMGMPGALSDRDIKFLKDSQIGIDRSPEGNRRMLEAFRAMENRKIEIARLADDYIAQNGRLDSGFNQMVREYAQANPLFPEGPTRITTQDEFNALPSGAEFIAPDGSRRRKP